MLASGAPTPLRAASPGKTPGEAQRQNPIRKSTPQARGSEIDANGVPNVLAVMLFTPVTYWSSNTFVTNIAAP